MNYTRILLIILAIGLLTAMGSAGQAAEQAKAVFAGGCFWCMEEAFEQVEGVLSVTSGYMGGHKANPTYEEVSAGITGHAESVEIAYDPARVSYRTLLDHFWKNVDPLTPNAQFCDHGTQYRSAIFYGNEEEKRLAEASKQAIEQSNKLKGTIVTQLVKATTFYPAEDYHQDFYKKNPLRYKFYKLNCGRVARLEQLWGKKS